MAVITAAVSAVVAAAATVGAAATGAATVAAAVASVASAVVAVSTAVGVAGLVVGGIGMAIGNKDLMFAGKIMGYVGMAGGLAGGLIGGIGAVATESGLSFAQGFGGAFTGASQHLSEAWNNGVGGWLSGGDKVTGAITTQPASSPGTLGPGGNPASQLPEVGGKVVNTVGDASKVLEVPGASSSGVNSLDSVMAPAPNIPGGGATPVPTAPVTQVPGVPQISAYTPISGPQNTIMATKLAAGGTPAAGGGLVDTLSGMPDWMKYSMATTGLQGVTGLAGGYFQGQSAEEQLAQQKLVAQREENQRQLLNRQGNQIPTFRFNA